MTATAQELYDKMLELYPNRVNPGRNTTHTLPMRAVSTRSGECTSGLTAHRKGAMKRGYGFGDTTSTNETLDSVGHAKRMIWKL
jgi:hypothetical protein